MVQCVRESFTVTISSQYKTFENNYKNSRGVKLIR